MSLQSLGACPHQPRPGTTVCLHCRREARQALHRRRRRVALKASVITIAVGVALTVVAGVTVAISDSRPTEILAAAETAVDAFRTRLHTAAQAGHARVIATATRIAHEDVGRVFLPVALLTVPPAPPLPQGPPLLPIVAEGATRLRDSVVAIRRGDSVTVHFDTPRGRTRRPEKFEQIVRATLPAIYGPFADSVLVHIPAGDLTRGADLLTDLPTRGLRLSLGAGWALALWPETRRGQDGPLVVMYRAQVTRLQ